ncbi:MAG: MFS transporter [Bacteroidota bacterium]
MNSGFHRVLSLPTFRSLQHRNYRLFFFGQILSLIGTWMQSMALAWLVYQLTYSAVWLGAIGFLNSIPILFFSMFGGSLADRMSKHRLIIITQVLSLLQALLLSVLVFFNLATIEIVALLAFTLGTINAYDIPARQSFIVDLVGKENLTNAIALNSATFNAARIVGPAVGGLIVAALGVGWCFFLNAVSFFAVIAGLVRMEIPEQVTKRKTAGVFRSLTDSIHYIRSEHSLVALLSLVAVITIFGWSYSVLLPIFADEILNIGAVGLGNLLTAVGIGAFISAVSLASFESKYRPSTFIYGGIGIFVIFVSIFAVSSDVSLSVISLIGVGMGLVMFLATANASIQRRVPDELRGRVMGLYSLIFQGLSPFGSIGIGLLAHGIGVRWAVLTGALVCGIVTLSVKRMMIKYRNALNSP